MNLKKSLFGILASAGLLGVGLGTFLSPKTPVAEVKAETSSITLYCRVLSGFTGTVNCYYWGGTTPSAWPGAIAAADAADPTLYSCGIPADSTSFIWDTPYNETVNPVPYHQSKTLVLGDFIKYADSSTQVVYNVSANDNFYDNANFGYLNYPSLTSDYMRLWLDRNGHEDGINDFWTLSYTFGGTEKEILPRDYSAIYNSKYFAYFDIPTSAIGGTFHFSSYVSPIGGGDFIFAGTQVEKTTDAVLSDGNNACIFQIGDSSALNFVTIDGSSATKVDVTALPSVFAAYYTCLSSKNNGYGSANVLQRTWIEDPSISTYYTVGLMTGVWLYDFSDQADYSTGTRDTTKEVTVEQKYDALMTQFNTHSSGVGLISSTGNSSSDNSTLPAVLIGLSIGAGAAIIAFLKAKKKEA
jgi:hypothetical protein